jgi:hypothetical protein
LALGFGLSALGWFRSLVLFSSRWSISTSSWSAGFACAKIRPRGLKPPLYIESK